MAQRKEVFQSKVLMKLFPTVCEGDREPSSPSIVDALAEKTYKKRKTCKEGTADGGYGQTHSMAKPGGRVYTVLPPPADYTRHSEKSLMLPHLESAHSAKDPSEESNNGSSDELSQDKKSDEVHKGKRRRKKRKSTLHQNPVQNGEASISESNPSQCPLPADEGGERVSRNRKRKLKKKRHKEKLLSMGLMPRASALEFTYQKDAEVEEGKEDNERRADEMSAFLRTTLEIYMTDSSVQVDKLPLISETVANLLNSISSGCRPTSVLQQLCSLKVYVQQKETDKLENALKELYTNSFMSEEETSAVNSLFQYWITDILPMQGDKTARLSTTHS